MSFSINDLYLTHQEEKLCLFRKMNSLQIIGTGQALGSEVVTNEQLGERFGIECEWIFSRTGIRNRRKASSVETASELALTASFEALEMANLRAEQIDLIICTAMFPEQALPSTACLIQAKLGAINAVAFDLTAACSGFVFGLETAKNFALSGNYQNILLIGVDLMTRFVSPHDCHTNIIFADGAGAVLLSTAEQRHFLASRIFSDGSNADLIRVQAGGTKLPASCETIRRNLHFMQMQGREVFRQAVLKMSESCLEVLDEARVSIEQIKMVIPHQANQRIINAVGEKLNLPQEKVFSNIEFIGNTGSATIPIALDDCLRKGLIGKDDLILFTAFGGGTTWGSCLVRL